MCANHDNAAAAAVDVDDWIHRFVPWLSRSSPKNNCYPDVCIVVYATYICSQKRPAKISSTNLSAGKSLFGVLEQFHDNHVCQQPDNLLFIGFLYFLYFFFFS